MSTTYNNRKNLLTGGVTTDPYSPMAPSGVTNIVTPMTRQFDIPSFNTEPGTTAGAAPAQPVTQPVAPKPTSTGVTEIATTETATPEISIADRIGSFMSRAGGDLEIVKPTSKLDALGQALAGIGRNISNSYVADKELEKKVKLEEMLAKRKADQEFEAKIGEYVYNADPETSKAFVEKVQDDIKAGTSRLEAMKNNQGLLRRGYAPQALNGSRSPEGMEFQAKERERIALVNQGYEPNSVDKALESNDRSLLVFAEQPDRRGSQTPKGWTKLNEGQILNKDTGEVRDAFTGELISGPTGAPVKSSSAVTNKASNQYIPPAYRSTAVIDGEQQIVDARNYVDPTTGKRIGLENATPGQFTGGLKTEGQKKNYILLTGAIEARKNLKDSLGDFDPTTIGGAIDKSLPNFMQSEDAQVYNQAVTTYTEMLSKLLTGAAGTEYEAKIYKLMNFPSFGSDAATVKAHFSQIDSLIKSIAEGTSPEVAVYANNTMKNQGDWKFGKKPTTYAPAGKKIEVGGQTMVETPTGYVNEKNTPSSKPRRYNPETGELE